MRNRYWFLAQSFLLLLIVFWPFKVVLHMPLVVRCGGALCLSVGIVLTVYAKRTLKENLTPLPKPRVGGCLVTTGLYGIVRHPAYSGIVISALGYSFWENDAIRFVLTGVLCILFDFKSKIEEKWLEKTYPEYANYKKRVTKRFIPWVY